MQQLLAADCKQWASSCTQLSLSDCGVSTACQVFKQGHLCANIFTIFTILAKPSNRATDAPTQFHMLPTATSTSLDHLASLGEKACGRA